MTEIQLTSIRPGILNEIINCSITLILKIYFTRKRTQDKTIPEGTKGKIGENLKTFGIESELV